MTSSEHYTVQFYTWEYRARGLHEEKYPVALEPPFMPFIRHLPQPLVFDEGKRPTWLSRLAEAFSVKKHVVEEQVPVLDYEHLEAFPSNVVSQQVIFKVFIQADKKTATQDVITALLGILSATKATVSFEIIGNSRQIVIQFVCASDDSSLLQSTIPAYLTNCIIQNETTEDVKILKPHRHTSVISFALAEEFVRPLRIYNSKEIDTLTALLGLMESIIGEEQLGIQILFQGCVNSWNDSILYSVTGADGKSFFMDAPEAPKIALDKISYPLFGVSMKLFVQTQDIRRREELLFNAIHAIQQATQSPFNKLVPIVENDIPQAMQDIEKRTSHRTGMLLNAAELATIVHIPKLNMQSKKLLQSTRKTTSVPNIAKGHVCILGNNQHHLSVTSVTVSSDARLKHMHIIGATGTGKSTLIANIALQDISIGNGVCVLDPHGDLVEDIIARIPANRIQDVVLIDPTDTEFPIGLNILAAHTEIEKEILASDLVASFRKFSTSWGDQMNTVLSNAIIAILENSKGGSLHDLRRFLIEDRFRNQIVESITDPAVKYYWLKEYPLSKSSSIGSIITRLDTFLRAKVIRNMVVQQQGIDFEQLMQSNAIIFIKLSQGLLGKENSYLLGSLIVSKLHQAAFARQQFQQRHPFFIYIDEFQNFITPSIIEMLSGVRKYSVGLTLSHQDLQQLQREDAELLNSVLSNVYTRIIFRVGEPDAKKLQDGLGEFDSIDLQNLGKGEAIVRIEQPQYTTSLETIPLDSFDAQIAMTNRDIIVKHCRKMYSTPREVVEKALFSDIDFTVIEKTKKISISKQRIETSQIEGNSNISKDRSIVHNDTKDVDAKDNQSKNDAVMPVSKVIEPLTNVIPKENTRDVSTHKYLQNLVKKMAEAQDFTAVIEQSIPNGQIDVLLSKNDFTIAVEICHTTDAEWEVHNIQKCLDQQINLVISLSGDVKQLDKIHKKCTAIIPDFDNYAVLFMTPDVLFEYLAQNNTNTTNTINEPITTMKGYRVTVSYDAVTNEAMKQKRSSVAQVVMKSLHKRKK